LFSINVSAAGAMETQEIEQINEWDEYKKISSMSNEDLL
jgi:hypothetical protein